MSRKISSADVAKEAGVSRTTVSYVLNNIDTVKIKSDTREKVLQVAQKLGYFGNSIARSMKTGQVMSIGFVSDWNVTHQRFVDVLNGMKDVLTPLNYSITLCSDTNKSGFPEFINYYLAKKIDGIVLLSSDDCINPLIFEILREKGIPSVITGYHETSSDLNFVNIDYYQGAYAAAKYLIDIGHIKIISMLHSTSKLQEKLRLDGINKAVEDNYKPGMSLRSIIVPDNAEDSLQVIENILETREDYSAVIVSWRATAFNTLYTANRLNIRIPEELAVISLDGSDFADYSYPRLSTSDLPLYELGAKSASLLIDTIQSGSKGIQYTLPCSLNLRETT